MNREARGNRRVAAMLAGVIALSFLGGVVMFLPAEHRASKLAEMRARYEAKFQDRLRQPAPAPDRRS